MYRDGGHSAGHQTTESQCTGMVVIVWGIESVLGRCGGIKPPKVNVLGRWSQYGALKMYWDGVGH